jgi:alpha-L-fucosidase
MYGEGPTQPEGGGHFTENNEARFTAHDFRFTVKDDALYAICLGRPGDQVIIKSLGEALYDESEISGITMLGVEQELKWKLDEDGLSIETPAQMPCEHAFTFKVSLT